MTNKFVNMKGYIRLTNKRVNMGSKPKFGEKIVEFDRTSPTLGNRHILQDHNNAEERNRVVGNYKVDLDAD